MFSAVPETGAGGGAQTWDKDDENDFLPCPYQASMMNQSLRQRQYFKLILMLVIAVIVAWYWHTIELRPCKKNLKGTRPFFQGLSSTLCQYQEPVWWTLCVVFLWRYRYLVQVRCTCTKICGARLVHLFSLSIKKKDSPGALVKIRFFTKSTRN